jgi:UDP-N-acetylmuramate dehydrogenase
MIADFTLNTKVRASVSLANMTSFKVGGLAEWFLDPHSPEDLRAGLVWRGERQLPLTLLGAGSNLLIGDRGLSGLVVCMRHLRGIHFDDQTGQVTAAAGEPVARLAWQAAARGWSGLEWAVGIPGTVGGLVVMNAGAQGGCAAERLVEAQMMSSGGEAYCLKPEDLGFSYRTSVLQGSDRIVTGATLQLTPGGDPAKVTASTDEHLKARHATQPYHLPSCGSVFRNPYPKAAAWLIEQTGLKGYQIGNAQVAQLHANFIVNRGGATASDISRLIAHIQEQVQQKWSLLLEPEVKFLGQF